MASMDFYGFSFNGIHSSELNILRVSNGSRYDDQLVPAFQDTVVSVPGGDGTYFFDSFYTNKTFTINIAFDSLTESQFRKLRQVFSTKNMGPLIFDETPYKAYTAKIQSPPQIKYVCFDEEISGDTSDIIHNHDLGAAGELASSNNTTYGRVYKGEGTIQFICYYPYARSVHKYLNEYLESVYANRDEWAAASGLLASKGQYDGTGTTIKLYNPGDLETDFMGYYAISEEGCALTQINLQKDNSTIAQLNFSTITRKNSSDAFIRINSKTNLIEGCDSNYEPTGSLYNEFIVSGDFFKIPLISLTDNYNYGSVGAGCTEIKYDYLYY